MAKKLKELGIITVGTLMVAIGIYFFKFPNNFSTGGVSGISVILKALIPGISSGTFVLIINAALLVGGFLVFGKNFGLKTVYCSILMSLAVYGLEYLYPMSHPLTDQPFLELVFSVIFPAVGSAILFNAQASTGGTDIVAMIFRRFTNVDIGKALFCTDFLIATLSGVVFGITTGLYSLLGLLAKALVVDEVIENINLSKYFTIVTENSEEICEFIKSKLNRSATVLSGEGAFLHQNKRVILTVLNRPQAVKLRNYIKTVDEHAFVVISNTSQIIGKGFREMM
ncbi:MAG: YitT family protein [Eubacteriales bacterium]|nr:YitT family protein [Eubacteriales bacterium]